MPYPSMPYGRPRLKWPYGRFRDGRPKGWLLVRVAAHRASGLRPCSITLETPRRTPLPGARRKWGTGLRYTSGYEGGGGTGLKPVAISLTSLDNEAQRFRNPFNLGLD
jgi:hypothetical protein